MNQFVKETLRKLLKEQGEYLCSDINRLTDLLNEECPLYKNEISVLILAVQEGLISELKRASISDVFLQSLSIRLHNATGIDKALAEWSIKAWVEALRLGLPSSKCQDGERLLYCSDFYFPSNEWGEGAADNYRAFRQDGFYHIAIYRSYWMRFQYPRIPIADFRVQVDAEFITNSGKTTECGIVFRLRSDNSKSSYYKFAISQSGYYALHTHVNEEWKNILNYSFSEFIRPNDSTNSLMVEMLGQKITLGINGHILTTVNDRKLAHRPRIHLPKHDSAIFDFTLLNSNKDAANENRVNITIRKYENNSCPTKYTQVASTSSRIVGYF